MTNKCELPINTVMIKEPKVLIGSSQKMASSESIGLKFPILWTIELPVDRKSLTHSDIQTEHGKPVFLPKGKASRKVRRWECG